MNRKTCLAGQGKYDAGGIATVHSAARGPS